jgi:hypothetical protein
MELNIVGVRVNDANNKESRDGIPVREILNIQESCAVQQHRRDLEQRLDKLLIRR